MEYILLDLEWNTSFSKKHSKYINEIIEIGAVKLDSDFRIISKFNVMVKSQLTNKLCLRFKTLTSITNEEMLDGVSFASAIKSFEDWADNGIFMSWSDSDIYALFDNCRFLLGYTSIPFIIKYVDLQSYVQSIINENGGDIKSQISLGAAAQLLDIDTEKFDLHRAINDSMLLREVFRKTYNENKLQPYMIDTTEKNFYNKMLFKPYIISDINSKFVNKRDMKFYCDKCRILAKKTTTWAFEGHCFKAEFKCPVCNDRFIGRISIKKQFDKIAVRRYKSAVPIKANNQ